MSDYDKFLEDYYRTTKLIAFGEIMLDEVTKQDEHCERLYWFADRDMPERGVKKGEPYCCKCPGIPLMGTHCCWSCGCVDRIREHFRRLRERAKEVLGREPKWTVEEMMNRYFRVCKKEVEAVKCIDTVTGKIQGVNARWLPKTRRNKNERARHDCK